jgi:hypothetical protein
MIDVKDELPPKSDIYLARRKVHKNPTIAFYNSVTQQWLVSIGTQYWVITGVQMWMDLPGRREK